MIFRMGIRLLFILLFIPLTGVAQYEEIVPPPSPQRLVVDYGTNFLSAGEMSALERKLTAYDDSTGTQITVVMVPDLNDYPPSDYATRLGEYWGVGQGKFDNGVVILIMPVGGPGDRETFIATGYGVEAELPDNVCMDIVDKVLIPHFKSGSAYTGLDLATDEIIQRLEGVYVAPPEGEKWKRFLPFAVIVIIFIIFSYIRRRDDFDDFSGNGRSRTRRSAPWIFYGGGGGFGGGSSGGGFGGFGGGSFGGGGAGGSW